MVDREAKEVAKGCTSDTEHLPPYLRKPLLTDPTAVKAMHSTKLKSKWQNDWKNSARGKLVTRINDTTPSSKFLKSISNCKLSRAMSSRIAQLRLLHVPLNGYLKRIRKVDSARCPACREDKENTEHFLLRCPSYVHERWTFI